ncbi:putative membrane protein [Babesia divergens]|uniref:Membrane protein n=1 Tax=Babesia divergens TaxID=32595 RepID=A0AAD9G6W7_BABDI|nr:putative membrane protein [Babesia divergens]
MMLHKLRGFKALVACLYVFPFYYFVVLIMNNLNGTNISRRIRSGLCRATLAQEWVNTICKCELNMPDSDLLLDYHTVDSFRQHDDSKVVFVETVKTKSGTSVSDMSRVPHALHELLRLCQSIEAMKNIKLGVQKEGTAILKDICHVIDIHLSRNMPTEIPPGKMQDIWEPVIVLLRTASTMKGAPLLALLSQLTVTQESENGAQKESTGMKHLRSLLVPFLHYVEQQRINVKPTKGVTTDIILKNPNPMSFVAESAFPQYLSSDLGIAQDDVIRIFTTFPEAAAALAYAVEHKIASYIYIHRHDVADRLCLLSLFLANLQVLVSITFDKISTFAEIASDKDIDTMLNEPLKPFWEVFVTDEKSKAYLINVLNRASKARVHEAFHANMEQNIVMATRVTAYMASKEQTYDRTMLGRSQLIERATRHMLQMAKFMLSDTDHSGYVTLPEFVRSVMGDGEEAEVFNEHMKRVMENQGDLFLYYDFDFLNGRAKLLKHHHRMQLEAINPMYNEVLDTFMILDADGSGEISLEEFLEHSHVTSTFSTVDVAG